MSSEESDPGDTYDRGTIKRPQAKKDQKAVVGTKQTKKHQRNTGRMLFVGA